MDSLEENNNEKVTVTADKSAITNNSKETSTENLNAAKDENIENKKVPDDNEKTEVPCRPTACNGAYSHYFNPIPAENENDNKANIKPSSVELSK